MASTLLTASTARASDSAVRSTAGYSSLTMTDTLTPKERSERMSRIRSKDTKPEMIVRRLVHGDRRYRLLECGWAVT